ncbi:MAG: Thymidylate kinase [Eubacteriales bacterium SKADARSKE-1]|nr:Thymidylate kinase [Eubacteriales bacterium SKADARSKE-1]
MSIGKLIVMEGLDGSGKATQTGILCSKLRQYNKRLCRISFPNYEEPSSALVKMYLNSEFGKSPESINAYAASSFYAVDRYASYIKFWKERYERGQVVIADRYTTSNAVYQLPRLKKDEWDLYLNWLEDYEYAKLSLPRPSLVIYLDMPVEISQKFMTQRYKGEETKKDLFEKNVEYLNKCRKSALYTAKKLNWKIVTCNEGDNPKTVDEIHNKVFNLVKEVVF